MPTIPPSSRPTPSSAHEIMPHVLPASTHSSAVRPARSEPIAIENGTAKEIRPVISMGGCTNMPGCVKSGLMPRPSGGTNSSRAKGFARKTITARKKSSTSMSTAPMCGMLGRNEAGAKYTASAARTDRANAMKRSDPSFPA